MSLLVTQSMTSSIERGLTKYWWDDCFLDTKFGIWTYAILGISEYIVGILSCYVIVLNFEASLLVREDQTINYHVIFSRPPNNLSF